MRPLFTSALSMALLAVATATIAQAPAAQKDHAAHQPEGASAAASGVKKPPAKAKKGKDMGKMHDEAHQPGGMHDQMHGKGGKMGGPASAATPAASAASK